MQKQNASSSHPPGIKAISELTDKKPQNIERLTGIIWHLLEENIAGNTPSVTPLYEACQDFLDKHPLKNYSFLNKETQKNIQTLRTHKHILDFLLYKHKTLQDKIAYEHKIMRRLTGKNLLKIIYRYIQASIKQKL